MAHAGLGAVIVNEGTNLYHGLYFQPVPAAGNGDDASVEYETFLIGTKGHERLDDAAAEVRTTCERFGWSDTLSLFHWDGIGLPSVRSPVKRIQTPDEARAEMRLGR